MSCVRVRFGVVVAKKQKSKNFAAGEDIFLGSLRKSQLGLDFGLLLICL